MSRTATARRELVVAVVVLLVVLGAAYAMTRVFLAPAWVRPTVAAAGLSVVTAASARRIGLPAVGSLLLSAAGLVVFTYVVHLPAGPLIPGAAEFDAARQLLADALVALRDQPAPTDPLPELVFLVTLATWVVAFATHEVTVRLRRPGIALVAAAALWMVPLSMPQPTQATARVTVPFLLAAAMLLLLESDADLAGWARERIAPRITVAGSALALVAVAVGAMAPGILPGYGQPPVLDLGGSSDPRGYQPIVDIGDRLTLPVDRTVLRVASDRRVYLRLAALDTFDANTWRLGPPGSSSFVPDRDELYPGDGELRFETAIATADTAVVDIEVVDLENIYVPVPYQPVQVNGDAAEDMVWSRVGGFLATGELSDNELGGTLRTGVTPGLRYQVVSAIPNPTIEQLRNAEPDPQEVQPWLQLPDGQDRWSRYAEQAQAIYDERDATTAVDRALALQHWFTREGGFEYAVAGIDPLRGPNPLEAFVFDTKVGYCEYFATAMAVMLRASGVPARVAVGFLPGELVVPPDPAGGEDRGVYEVSTSDAHSWVEVLFPGHGWIKFDPTPRSDGTTLPPDEQNLDPEVLPEEAEDLLADSSDSVPVPDTPQLPPEDLPQPPAGEAGAGSPDDAGSSSPVPVVIAALLGLLGLAGLAILLRSRDREVGSGRAAALDAQRRVLHAAARLGIGRHESETATEALHRWASEGRCDPAAAAVLARIAQRAAFAPTGASIDGERAMELSDDIIHGLRAAADTAARVVAPVRLPIIWITERARDALTTARDLLRV